MRSCERSTIQCMQALENESFRHAVLSGYNTVLRLVGIVSLRLWAICYACSMQPACDLVLRTVAVCLSAKGYALYCMHACMHTMRRWRMSRICIMLYWLQCRGAIGRHSITDAIEDMLRMV